MPVMGAAASQMRRTERPLRAVSESAADDADRGVRYRREYGATERRTTPFGR